MTPTEKNVKFTGNYLEVNQDYEINARVIFQGEGEVTKTEQKSIGKDGECNQITHIMPLIIEIKPSEGTYQPKVIGTSGKKSKSKQLRDLLFIYWSENQAHKYPVFEVFYNAYIDRQMDKIRQKIDGN
jgi:hypothetical protein